LWDLWNLNSPGTHGNQIGCLAKTELQLLEKKAKSRRPKTRSHQHKAGANARGVRSAASKSRKSGFGVICGG
jgi:hypothetical protein